MHELRDLVAATYSFRDPNSHVEVADGVVRRVVTGVAAGQLTEFLASPLFEELVDAELIEKPTDVRRADDGAVELLHRPIESWTYPYEWTWSMLRDAAVVHLEILRRASDYGFTLSDATSFNVTFRGSTPVFIDYGSFVTRSSSDPWWGYTQFCEHFLYPLMVSAHTGAALQPILRGGFGRVQLDDAHALLRTHKRKRGVVKHVLIPHAAVHRADMSVGDVTEATTAVTTEVYNSILDGMARLIDRLAWSADESTWSDYAVRSHYSDGDLRAKEAFVDRVCAATEPTLVMDIGANDGHFSKICAQSAEHVIAADGDPLVIDRLYRSGLPSNITPLVFDATDPAPSRGWRLAERASIADRMAPDLVVLLAVLHHICLTGNVPLPQVVAWLEDFDSDFVIEFVHRDDEKVRHLLARKGSPDDFDYDLDVFLDECEGAFEVVEQERLTGGTRTMLHLRRRSAGGG